MKIEGIKQTIRYHKIDMEKMDKAKMLVLQEKIDTSIKKIDKVIDMLKHC